MTQATKSRARKASVKTAKRKAAKTRKPSAARSSPSSNHGSSNSTGHEVVQAAKKAKTPLIASGAAVAGAAGGMALGVLRGRKSKALRRPLVKVDSGDVAKAAKSVGQFGVEMGELASELRKNREMNGTGRRSPIEVVLEGLTHRSKTS